MERRHLLSENQQMFYQKELPIHSTAVLADLGARGNQRLDTEAQAFLRQALESCRLKARREKG